MKFYLRLSLADFHEKQKMYFFLDLLHRVSLSLDNKGGKQEYNFIYATK
jgi:hypothetical protein